MSATSYDKNRCDGEMTAQSEQQGAYSAHPKTLQLKFEVTELLLSSYKIEFKSLDAFQYCKFDVDS